MQFTSSEHACSYADQAYAESQSTSSKYGAPRDLITEIRLRLHDLDDELVKAREQRDLSRKTEERTYAALQNSGCENAKLRQQLEETERQRTALFMELDSLRASTSSLAQVVRHLSGTQNALPVKFVLDVNMPPDQVEIRNSNGEKVTITGIDPG